MPQECAGVSRALRSARLSGPSTSALAADGLPWKSEEAPALEEQKLGLLCPKEEVHIGPYNIETYIPGPLKGWFLD